MATKKDTNTTTTPETDEIKWFVQSNDPRDFGPVAWQGGIATVIKSVYAPDMWSEKSGKYGLFHILTLREEDGTEHKARYARGYFANTDPKPSDKKYKGYNVYPSKSGKSIAGPEDKSLEELMELYKDLGNGDLKLDDGEEVEYEGYFAISMAETRGGNNDDRQLLDAVRKHTTKEGEENSAINFNQDSRFLEGHQFYWDRLPQAYPFKTKDGEEAKEYKGLYPTKYFGIDEEWQAENKSSSTSSTSEKKSAASETETPESEETNEFADDIEMKVLGFLKKNKGKDIDKKAISTHVLGLFTVGDDRKSALNYVGNNKWMVDDARPWTYDDGKFKA